MSKLVGLSGFKNFDQFKSSLGSSTSATAKGFQISTRQPTYSNSSGSFANLKLTAEKLVKEQASAKTDLDLANSKLKKLSEHIRSLEEKLQNAYNENAKLKVKHKEDEKLWKGLESKFFSTKTLCDQLTETLQLLSDQVQDAEKDKAFFANKLSETSIALDNLHGQMKSLSLRLESSEQTIKNREKELEELGIIKENVEKQLGDEHCKVLSLTDEKENVIKNFEKTVAANESTIESLISKLNELQLELTSKEDRLNDMNNLNERKERENTDLIANNKHLTDQLVKTMQENQSLEDFVKMLTCKLVNLDTQSVAFWEKVVKVNAFFDSWFELLQVEKKLASEKAQECFDRLHCQVLNATSEKDALQLVNQELNNKMSELQDAQKSTIAKHAEECHVAEEKFLKLKSETETLVSKKAEMENLINTLEDKIHSLSEASRLSDMQMQDFQLKHLESENENKEIINNLESEIHKKEEKIDNLQKEIVKHEEHQEKQLNQLQSLLQEKEQVVVEVKEKEKQLEEELAEAQKLVVESEGKLAEAKKQYNQMLESKQLELSRHLKEISQKNDQAFNVIRKKYETEKQECINLEKEKAEKAVLDMQKKCEQKLSECQEESKQQLLKIEREHTALISKIRTENDNKEENLKSNHSEELKRMQLQAENELKEKTKLLKNKHEAELRELRSQHEEDCKHLEEELNIQKTKEERQKALLQMQWKVMSEDQEATSRKDLPYANIPESSVSKMLKKVEKASVLTIPKHSQKVTHHEYGVETSHGTITKRRKTKSTIIIQDPRKNKRPTPKVNNTPRNLIMKVKGGSQPNPANIGDLFSEGSLNPYADDPYAFD
ncbi:hypothetical protein L1887_21038 [Cichorium endivia]|nr:hypothetical protein L1887_21038 [Cichorium endivia]